MDAGTTSANPQVFIGPASSTFPGGGIAGVAKAATQSFVPDTDALTLN